MKILTALLLVVLVAPSALAAMTDEQKAAENNFVYGFWLGESYILGQSNASVAKDYNTQIQKHNTQLNQTYGAEDAKNYLLPPIRASMLGTNNNEIMRTSNGDYRWRPPYIEVFNEQISQMIKPSDDILKIGLIGGQGKYDLHVDINPQLAIR